jgi:hypothetical protein
VRYFQFFCEIFLSTDFLPTLHILRKRITLNLLLRRAEFLFNIFGSNSLFSLPGGTITTPSQKLWAIGHNYEMGLHKDNFSKIWCNLVQQFQRRRFKCDFLSKYARLLLFVFIPIL